MKTEICNIEEVLRYSPEPGDLLLVTAPQLDAERLDRLKSVLAALVPGGVKVLVTDAHLDVKVVSEADCPGFQSLFGQEAPNGVPKEAVGVVHYAGRKCKECGEFLFIGPAGISCKNGHRGEEDAV